MKKCFLTGLVIILPLTVTVWVILFIVRVLTNPFIDLVTHFMRLLPHKGPLSSEQGIHIISTLAILIGLFAFTLLLGLVARRFFFHSFIKFGDRLLEKIPLVNKVYKTTKEIVQALFTPKRHSFQQVVLIPFPYKGCYTIGLVSEESPPVHGLDASMSSVFIPTTPNPTSGYLTMVPKQELIYLTMKSDEAIKYVVSCAVIQPEINA